MPPRLNFFLKGDDDNSGCAGENRGSDIRVVTRWRRGLEAVLYIQDINTSQGTVNTSPRTIKSSNWPGSHLTLFSGERVERNMETLPGP